MDIECSMISIVISFYRPHFLNKLIQNIELTVGVEHEIITIENNNEFSIGNAYNKGIASAKFPIICFIHEDLEIETENWGNKLINIFKGDPNIGLIGVAGNKKKTKAPSQTWSLSPENYIINIKHVINGEVEHIEDGWENETLKKAMIVDGVFMAIQKNQGLHFNSKIPGFHFYDMSISLECHIKKLQTVVTKEVLIKHYSKGSIDQSWIYPAHIFHSIYKRYLPLSLSEKPSAEEERKHLAGYIIFSVENKFLKISLIYWLKYFIRYPFAGFNLLYFRYLIKNIF